MLSQRITLRANHSATASFERLKGIKAKIIHELDRKFLLDELSF